MTKYGQFYNRKQCQLYSNLIFSSRCEIPRLGQRQYTKPVFLATNLHLQEPQHHYRNSNQARSLELHWKELFPVIRRFLLPLNHVAWQEMYQSQVLPWSQAENNGNSIKQHDRSRCKQSQKNCLFPLSLIRVKKKKSNRWIILCSCGRCCYWNMKSNEILTESCLFAIPVV